MAQSTKKWILCNHSRTACCQGNLRIICPGQWRLHNCLCAIFKLLSRVRPLALISHYNVPRYILKVINCHELSDIISYLKFGRLKVSPSALAIVLFTHFHFLLLFGERTEEGMQREIKSLRSLLGAKVNTRQVTTKGSIFTLIKIKVPLIPL